MKQFAQEIRVIGSQLEALKSEPASPIESKLIECVGSLIGLLAHMSEHLPFDD